MSKAREYWKGDASQETTHLLADSLRIAKETEEIGEDTLVEMYRQGETLKGTRDKLGDIQDMTSSARMSIKQLQAKHFRKKMYLWIVIIALFLANIWVIVILIQNHGRLFG